MKTSITPVIMTKVWKLHLSKCDSKLISETLGISYNSANRVIQLMSMAQKGENIDSVGGTNHKKQKQFAKKFFGIPTEEEKPEKEVKETETHRDPADDQNVATFMLKVTVLLEEQNELLRKFLSAFGVAEEKR